MKDRFKEVFVIYFGGTVMGAAVHDWLAWQVIAPWPIWFFGALGTAGAIAYALGK